MTNEEIVRDYNRAANKSKQIKSLADLNQVSPSEIQTVLAKAGVAGVKIPSRIRQRRPAPEQAPDPAPAPDALPAFYGQMEAILAALPEEMSDRAVNHTKYLLQTLFTDYLELRLGKGGQDGACSTAHGVTTYDAGGRVSALPGMQTRA